jgi:phosphocarrier protein
MLFDLHGRVEKVSMLMEEFIIPNKLGLHARASALLVNNQPVQVRYQDLAGRHRVNGKSIMGIMMLAAAKGSVILVKVDGEDEVDAMNVLGELIQDGFGEE